jgi:hypothetical protein
VKYLLKCFFLVLASLILSVALSGGCMAAFRSLSSDGLISPYQALFAGLRKFFPLLWANILHSCAYGIGFLMLILPGFYLYGRLGLFPLFIMFENKGVMDSLGESWNVTDEVATKLFTLTAIFMSIQLGFGFIGGMMGADGALWFLIAATTVKYATLMPLFYLFYSLYESVKNKPQLEIKKYENISNGTARQWQNLSYSEISAIIKCCMVQRRSSKENVQ